MPENPSAPPITLIVDDQEWRARSLESIFGPQGYAIVKSYTGQQGLEVAFRVCPDVVIVDMHLPDMRGLDFIRLLLASGRIGRNTPVLVITSSPLPRRQRLEILEAGAWDVVHPPVDPDEILLRVGNWVAAKLDTDEALEESLLERSTGLYNLKGLMRRIRELSADAARFKRPLACIVVGPSPNGEGGSSIETAADGSKALAEVLGGCLRTSDTLGCIENGEYVIVAPGTDAHGASRLAERLIQALEGNVGVSDVDIKAGVYAHGGPEEEVTDPVAPTDLLGRATTALRSAQSGASASRIQMYFP